MKCTNITLYRDGMVTLITLMYRKALMARNTAKSLGALISY